jgi:hypothetical protein
MNREAESAGCSLGMAMFFVGKYRLGKPEPAVKMVGPPKKAPYVVPVVLWLMGFFIVMAFAGRGKLSWMMGVLAVSYLLLLPGYLLAALLYNFFVHPRKYKDWNEKFIRQQCGFRSRIRTGGTGVALRGSKSRIPVIPLTISVGLPNSSAS